MLVATHNDTKAKKKHKQHDLLIFLKFSRFENVIIYRFS